MNTPCEMQTEEAPREIAGARRGMDGAWVAVFCLMLVPCLLGAAVVWSVAVSGTLYYCSDDVDLVSFLPPFVHAGTDDYYTASASTVYALWLLFLAAVGGLAFMLTRRICRP